MTATTSSAPTSNGVEHSQTSGWRSSLVFGLPLLLMALAARTSRLSDSLWYDELWSTHIKLESLWSLAVAAVSDVHPPGYPVLMFAWIRLFGDSELAVRAVPVLAGVASVWLTYRFGRLAYGEFAGRLAAIMMAVAPAHVWYSQEARSYSLTVLLAILGAAALAELRQRPGARAWRWALWVSLVALPWLHYYNAGVVVVLAWSAHAWRHELRRRVLVTAAISVVAIGAYAAIKQQMGMLPTETAHLRVFGAYEFWRLLFTWFLAGNGFRWWIGVDGFSQTLILLVQIGAASVCLAGIVWSFRSRNADARLTPGLLFALPLLLFGLSFTGFGKTYIERSALAALPFFTLIIAAGVVKLRAPLRIAAAGIFVALQLSGLIASVARPDETTVYKPREEWRELAGWIDSQLTETDRQAVLVANFPALPLVYYSPRFGERIDFAAKLQERGERIAGRAQRFGIDARPLLDWIARGAEAAEARNRAANIQIVDGPMIPSTMRDLLEGRVVAPVVTVKIGSGELPPLIARLSGNARFALSATTKVRDLTAAIYRPVDAVGSQRPN